MFREGKRISQAAIEATILDQVGRDLTARHFAAALTREARHRAEKPSDEPLKALRKKVSDATATIGRMADLAAQCETPRPFLDKIAVEEKIRAKLLGDLKRMEDEAKAAEILAAVREDDVLEILAGLASHMATIDRDQLKDLLAGLVERVELDPVNRTSRIHYQIAAERGKLVASPRGFEPRFTP